MSDFEALNAHVVGVSADKPATQQKFIDAYSLEFPLISDVGKSIITAYGARAVLGVSARRSTFLIDPEGLVAYVWPDVKVEDHAQEVLETVKNLAESNA